MHLKTRLTLGVATAAVVTGSVLVPVASALAATPTLTVAPRSDSLYNSQTVQVSGSGFSPNQQVALAECNYARAQQLGLDDPNTLFAACDTNHAVLNAGTADAQGNLAPVDFTVYTGQTGTDAQSICDFSTNGQCVIAAGDPNTLTLIAAAPIAFSQVTADPNSNLTSGQVVQVTGAGLPASATVAVLQCNASIGDATGCNTAGAQVKQTDADGALPTTAVTVHTGQQGSNASSVCDASNNGACVIAVADPQTGATYGYAPITFAATHSATAVSIASSKAKVGKGDKFAIKGRDTAGSAGVNGVTVTLYQRPGKHGKWSKVDTDTTASKHGKPGFYKFGGLTEKRTKYYRVKTATKQIGGTIYDPATSSAVKVKFTG